MIYNVGFSRSATQMNAIPIINSASDQLQPAAHWLRDFVFTFPPDKYLFNANLWKNLLIN